MDKFFSRAAALMLALVMVLLPVGAMAGYAMPVADGDVDAVEGLDENWVNILLIGTDTREKTLDSGRADTMMICSINQETGDIKVTSLQRDTWVSIGDNGHQNKLNAAHTFGGPNLLMQTINRTFDLNIKEYVTVNFYGICDIVDAIGGVTVELEPGEPGTINSTVEPGYGKVQAKTIPAGTREATLCGTQALAYARIRKLDNDFGRTNRQRKLIRAVLNRLSECSLPEMISFAKTCLNYVSTNVGLMRIISLTTGVLGHGIGNISMRTIPDEGQFRYDSSNGVSKLIIDQAECTKLIHEFIYQ